jgi:hypothetical protein
MHQGSATAATRVYRSHGYTNPLPSSWSVTWVSKLAPSICFLLLWHSTYSLWAWVIRENSRFLISQVLKCRFCQYEKEPVYSSIHLASTYQWKKSPLFPKKLGTFLMSIRMLPYNLQFCVTHLHTHTISKSGIGWGSYMLEEGKAYT